MDLYSSPKPMHKMSSIFSTLGIPLMFATPLGILHGEMPKPLEKTKRQLDPETPEVRSAVARPIHKGAATKHFKKEKKTPNKTKAPQKRKKKAANKKGSQEKQDRAKAKQGDGDDVVVVRYTNAKKPVRTYVQAWREMKWKHVITVAEREHGKHSEIVHDVGEKLRSGQLTYDEARQQKKTVLSSWPK